MRIAVLFHKAEKNPSKYLVHRLAGFWRDDGHDVVYVMGVRRRVSADILLVHVDLSVVPSSYLEFASRFPVVLNGSLQDIRKSRVSKNLVRLGDSWQGPVIAKSDLNCFGWSERALRVGSLQRFWPWLQRVYKKVDGLQGLEAAMSAADQYRVFDSIDEIPREWFSHPGIVFEKFLPEVEDGGFHLRMYMVLGGRARCVRLTSNERIIKAHNSLAAVEVEPHKAAMEWRREFDLDYGKIDYVVHDDEPILLDVNKTIGLSSGYQDGETLRAGRRYLAEGLYTFVA